MSRIVVINTTSMVLMAIRLVGDNSLWIGQFTYEDFKDSRRNIDKPTSADRVKAYVRACLESQCQPDELIVQILPSPIDKLQVVIKTRGEFQTAIAKALSLKDTGDLEAMIDIVDHFINRP